MFQNEDKEKRQWRDKMRKNEKKNDNLFNV
jgi:hypothetical protein